MIVSLSNILCW